MRLGQKDTFVQPAINFCSNEPPRSSSGNAFSSNAGVMGLVMKFGGVHFLIWKDQQTYPRTDMEIFMSPH